MPSRPARSRTKSAGDQAPDRPPGGRLHKHSACRGGGTPKTGVTLPAGYRSPRCPSSIGRGPRPRPGSSCATAPPSVLEASCGAVAARRHWRVWMPLDVDRVAELPWAGGRCQHESPRASSTSPAPSCSRAWLARTRRFEVVATDSGRWRWNSWRRLVQAADPSGTADRRSAWKSPTERRSPTRPPASTPPTASR